MSHPSQLLYRRNICTALTKILGLTADYPECCGFCGFYGFSGFSGFYGFGGFCGFCGFGVFGVFGVFGGKIPI